jgi:hypothetical protein
MQKDILGTLQRNVYPDGRPKEIWLTEKADYLSRQPKNSPWDIELYSTIQAAIETGDIDIDTIAAITEGTNITITGAGTQEDPFVINGVPGSADTGEQIRDKLDAFFGDTIWRTHVTLLDEDDFVSNSDTQAPTQQSVREYVDNSIANIDLGNIEKYTKQKVGKAKFHAKPDSVIYVAEVGSTIIEIAEFGDISELNMIIDRAEDAINGSTYEITIRFADNTVNTWDPASGQNPEDHDLYIPEYRIYDATLTIPLVARQEFVDASSGNASNPIVPKFQFGNGQIKFKFDNTNGPWMATNRIMIQFNFARI